MDANEIREKIAEGLKKAGYSQSVIDGLSPEEFMTRGTDLAVKLGYITYEEQKFYKTRIRQAPEFERRLAEQSAINNPPVDVNTNQWLASIAYQMATQIKEPYDITAMSKKSTDTIIASLQIMSNRLIEWAKKIEVSQEKAVKLPEPLYKISDKVQILASADKHNPRPHQREIGKIVYVSQSASRVTLENGSHMEGDVQYGVTFAEGTTQFNYKESELELIDR